MPTIFLNNYKNCGQNHCGWLATTILALETNDVMKWQTSVGFEKWLMKCIMILMLSGRNTVPTDLTKILQN